MATLRKFSIYDSESFRILANSSVDIKRYCPFLVKKSPIDNSKLVLEFSQANFITEFDFLILNNVGLPVGGIFASQEKAYNSLNVSYFIGSRYRRMGYMKSGLNEFIMYCKDNTEYYSLYFDVANSNIASLTLLKKLKANYIGVSSEGLIPLQRFEIVLM